MNNEITYLDDISSQALIEKLERKQEKREQKLRAMGAKTVEAIVVTEEGVRSIINGEN